MLPVEAARLLAEHCGVFLGQDVQLGGRISVNSPCKKPDGGDGRSGPLGALMSGLWLSARKVR